MPHYQSNLCLSFIHSLTAYIHTYTSISLTIPNHPLCRSFLILSTSLHSFSYIFILIILSSYHLIILSSYHLIISNTKLYPSIHSLFIILTYTKNKKNLFKILFKILKIFYSTSRHSSQNTEKLQKYYHHIKYITHIN